MRRHDTTSVAAAVGRAIRTRRKKIRRTSSAVAHEARIDRTYLSQIERGLRQPTINIFMKIAAQLRVRPDRLLRSVMREMGGTFSTRGVPQAAGCEQPEAQGSFVNEDGISDGDVGNENSGGEFHVGRTSGKS